MTIRGHYLRGLLGGFLLGLALTIMLALYGVIRFGELTGLWILLLLTVLGVVWSFVAPAPAGTGAAGPAGTAPPPSAPVPPGVQGPTW